MSHRRMRKPGRSTRIYTGLDGLLFGMYGLCVRHAGRKRRLHRDAARVLELRESLASLSENDFQDHLATLRTAFCMGRLKNEVPLRKAMAALAEASRRALGMTPHPVQIMGGMAMFEGWLCEMATGEGKTLTACLPAILAGWCGLPCHVVTVNDYLVERDADLMRPLYDLAGVSVGFVKGEMDPETRRANYRCDVVYGTSKEILADFLRDRIKDSDLRRGNDACLKHILQGYDTVPDGPVMRGLGMAIVDEADSILIDEAVTPLIISCTRENRMLSDATRTAYTIAKQLEKDIHYTVDIAYRDVRLTSRGERIVSEAARGLPGIWKGRARREEIVGLALQAREFFHFGKHYVIDDGKVVIVDEFTGRLMPQRSWSQGLHQAIEAKEGVELTDPTETIAKLSFQRFFRMYPRLCGMTGNGSEAASELWHIYELPVVSIPTHRPCIRRDKKDRTFVDEPAKRKAILAEITRIHATGQPVLVGTRNVAYSEVLAKELDMLGLEYNLLNAVRHKEEAAIVAKAGEEGRITIATNMAGRGTDIKLGSGVREKGGLHVLAAERNDSRRVDRQLFGRCGRQGDPGVAQAFVCLDDLVIRQFLRRFMVRMITALGRVGLGWIVVAPACRYAQNRAEKRAYLQRKQVLKGDTGLADALSFAGPEAETTFDNPWG